MKYRTIVIDPPWDYGKDGERFPTNVGHTTARHIPMPYPMMPLPEIAALPIASLAETDCRLFLWTTNRFLPHSFALIEGWGFSYRQTLTWHKTRGVPVGSVAPSHSEFLLVAISGKPTTGAWFPSSVIKAPPGAHSTKPECFLDYIEGVSPAPRLEMFARRNRFGWDTSGNESLEHVELAT